MRIFTLRFNPVTDGFDDSAVAGFLADKQVLSIRDHFFVQDCVPYLTLVVRYRTAVLPAPTESVKSEQKRDDSWRELLTEADWPLFNSLRAWRSERAKQEGIPPYVIANNRQLAEVAKVRPPTLAGLGRIEGYLRYMDDLLLFADDKPTLHGWLANSRGFLQENLRLALKEEVTLLAPATEGIPFLGFRIYPSVLRLNQRTLRRFRQQVRGREKAYRAGRLGVGELTNSIASLFAHVAHADTLQLRRQAVAGSLDLG